MNNEFYGLNTYKILSIENETTIISDSLKNMVRSPKYSLVNATNLNDALSFLRSDNFDILIIDMSNFTKDQLTYLKSLRNSYPELYIILLINSEDQTFSIKEYKELSVQGYCEKNDKLEQLPLFIESAVKSLDQMKMIITINAQLLESKEQLVKAYLESIETLRYTVEAKDNYTSGHSDRVSEYSVLIGQKLGLPQEDIKNLQLGGLFHDIGKIGISDSILQKNGKLTDEEYNEIKKHPIIGKDILSNASIFENIISIVLYHHERYDGKGYPEGISQNSIPLLARIVSVADAFDAMTSKRSYRDELDLSFVKNEIRAKAGSQFDPMVANAFLDLLENDYNSILEIKYRY